MAIKVKIFFTSFLLLASFIGKSQNYIGNLPVNIKNNISLQQAMEAISEQTGAIFSYSPSKINTTKKVNLSKAKTLTEALNYITYPGMKYKISGKYIIISAITIDPPIVILTEPDDIVEREEIYCPKYIKTELPLNSIPYDAVNHTSKILPVKFAAATHSKDSIEKEHPKDKVKNKTVKNDIEEPDEPIIAETRLFQATLIYPLGTSGIKSKDYLYNFSFNLWAGFTGGSDGIEISPLININHIGTKKLQFAGWVNYSANAENCIQLSSLGNYVNKGKPDIQVSGIANISAKKAGKLQMATLVNYSGKGKSLLQLGLINKGHKTDFQVGIINICDTSEIAMIGLINIPKKGLFIEIESAHNGLFDYMAVHTGTKRLYGTLAFGYNGSAAIGSGIGTFIPIKKRFSMNIDLMSHSIAFDKFKNFENNLAELTPTLNYRIGKRFKLFAGPAINLMTSSITPDNKLIEKVPYTIVNTTIGDHEMRFWIDFKFGIRFFNK